MKLDLETNSDKDWEEHSTVEISLADGASYDVGGDSVQINLRDNDFPEATAVLTVAPTTVEEGDEVTATIVVTTKAAQQPHGYGGSLKLKTALRTDSDAAQSQDFVMRAVNQGSFGLSRPSFRPVTADDGVVTAYESVYIAKVTIADDGIAEDAETFDIVMEKFLANKDALTLDANTTPTTVTIAAHEGATMSQRMIHMTVVTGAFGSAGTTFTITWEDEDEDAGCSAGYNVYLDRAHRVEDGENVYQGLVHLGSAASHETRVVRTFTSVQSGDSRFDVKLYCGTDSGTLISEVFIPSQGLASPERPMSGTYSTKLPLTALSVSPGTLSPAFHSNTISYVVSDVPYENKRVTVNTVVEPGYLVTWGAVRNDADTGTAGRQVDLQVGENSFRLSVYKGTSQSYYDLTVKRTATPSRTGPDSLTVSGAIFTDYVESNTSSIATYAVADQNASVTWSLSGDDAEQFSINDAGVLEFISSPDYENPSDTNGDNVYQVTIEASDGTDTGTLGTTVTVTSDPTGEVVAKPNTQATGVPIIDGIPRVGETLTADTSGIDDEDELTNVAFAYQWMRRDGSGDAAITAATGSTYTLVAADEGMSIKVKVSFTDDEGNPETLASDPTGAVALDPGPLTVFKVVDASTDPDTPLGALVDGGTLILGNPTGGEYGVRVNTDSSHDDHDDIQKVVLALSGAKTEGKTEWDPPYSLYGDSGEENLDGEDLPAGSYDLQATVYDDDGDVLGILTVSFAVEEYVPPVQEQQAVAANTQATGQPIISGTVQVGETLTADVTGIADEDGLTNVVFSYQWMADDTNIQGATGSSYTLTEDDKGKAITVRVSFTDDANNEESLTSEPTGPVVPDPGPLTVFKVVDTSSDTDTVLGTLEDGGALPLANPASGSYGIRVDTDSGHDDHDDIHKVELALSGAKTEGKEEWVPPYSLYGDEGEGNLKGENLPAGAYELKATAYDDDGDALGTLKVSFTVTAGQPAQQPTVVPNTSATGVPTISGTAQVGETLTADTTGIADADGLTNAVFIYQWMADDTAIQDATGSSYTLTGDDAGKAITVTVSFTDDANNVETLTSEPTGPVVPDPGPLTVFKVVDTSSDTDTVLGTLEDGGALPLANPASGSYGIRVDTDSGHDDHDDIHKVELALSGAKTEGKEEWVPPYSLYGMKARVTSRARTCLPERTT